MMKYMLDTNIIIYFLRGDYPEIANYLKSVPAKDIFVPAVVLAELEYGAKKSDDYEKSIGAANGFLKAFEVAGFGVDAAKVYGELRAELQKKGTPIGANDMLIAATAMSTGATLVTNNMKEFRRIDNLKLENWTEICPWC